MGEYGMRWKRADEDCRALPRLSQASSQLHTPVGLNAAARYVKAREPTSSIWRVRLTVAQHLIN
jgi:hypothetical protein